jgi:hypothetical protein
MGITVRALLRKNVEPYEELGLAEDKFTDDQLIDFMLQHPIPNPFGCQITKTMVRTKIAPASNIKPPDRATLSPCICQKLTHQLSELFNTGGL